MALKPKSKKHAAQIAAGTTGRNTGHKFEELMTGTINAVDWSIEDIAGKNLSGNLFIGNPAFEIVKYILKSEKIKTVSSVKSSWLGGLAMSGHGHIVKDKNDQPITKSKSDIIIEIVSGNSKNIIGVSVKSYNNSSPTNAQLYFSTASAFSQFLRANRINISDDGEEALKMFCGDASLQPVDLMNVKGRKSDTRRFFWEELPEKGRKEWENLFSKKQNKITRLILQKAYKNDPFAPNYVVHKTKKVQSFEETEIAIYSVEELIALSKKFAGFELKPYHIRKGSFKNDPNEHLAPRFGVVQMQRGGQKQYPTQLQFNLQAGYFYRLAGLS